ncbi:MAG: hypothetical protein HYY21_09060 [Candidatus Tectomicrobia bacterium]|nr:hypothetical protein [Candidatus Tectomicrobia bacterium]
MKIRLGKKVKVNDLARPRRNLLIPMRNNFPITARPKGFARDATQPTRPHTLRVILAGRPSPARG